MNIKNKQAGIRSMTQTMLKVIIFAFYFYPTINHTYAQDDVFKLGTTPFIQSGKSTVFFSYGKNYGSPGVMITQWFLPNYHKNVLFEEYKGGISFNSDLQCYIKISQYHRLAFNDSHIGIPQVLQTRSFGVKWRFSKSKNWFPDMLLKFEKGKMVDDMEFPISLSIGSTKKSFQYYANIDFYIGMLIIPFPNRYSIGVSMMPVKYVTLFGEYAQEPHYGGGPPDVRSLRSGINLRINQFVNFDISYFYFNFHFQDIIPGRYGRTWKDPTYIITVPAKEDYHLFSFCINFLFNWYDD